MTPVIASPAPDFRDDDLSHLEAHGVPPLPTPVTSGHVDNENARLWHASFGHGPPVLLLHGGLGNSDNWAYQVPALVEAGYTAIVIDSRGHGRSTRDAKPYSYELMASDTRAVMDALGIARAAFVGWSDGADIALVLSHDTPDRSSGVFFFACNVDDTGTKPFRPSAVIDRIYRHHMANHEALSLARDTSLRGNRGQGPLPPFGSGLPAEGWERTLSAKGRAANPTAAFEALRDDLGVMQAGQPAYGPERLAQIAVPVWSVLGEHDEFIERGHAEYIARAIPGARFVLLPGVSHFAPLQRPGEFNRAMLAFLALR